MVRRGGWPENGVTSRRGHQRVPWFGSRGARLSTARDAELCRRLNTSLAPRSSEDANCEDVGRRFIQIFYYLYCQTVQEGPHHALHQALCGVMRELWCPKIVSEKRKPWSQKPITKAPSSFYSSIRPSCRKPRKLIKLDILFGHFSSGHVGRSFYYSSNSRIHTQETGWLYSTSTLAASLFGTSNSTTRSARQSQG